MTATACYASHEEMLIADNKRFREAGCELAEAAMRVAKTYDGVHRLMLASSKWALAIANEGGRDPRKGTMKNDAVGAPPFNDGLGWNPIATAPTDGEEFLTCNMNQGGVKRLVSRNTLHGYWQSKGVPIHLPEDVA